MDDDNEHTPLRSTTHSPTSPSSDEYSESDLPHRSESSPHLVLLPQSEDSLFDIPEDEDTDEEETSEQSNLATPPLSPSTVLLYLFSPYLRLGAFSILSGYTPIQFGVPALVVSAALSIFCRQIWFLQSRYLRRSTTKDILLDAFAKGRRKRKLRKGLASLVSALTWVLRVLMAAMYLRESTSALLVCFPSGTPAALVSICLALVAICFSLTTSISSKSIILVTYLSAASFLGWLVSAALAYARNNLTPGGWSQQGILWNGITSTMFAFTTASTVPLSSCLKSGRQASYGPKPDKARSRSFVLLSVLSASLAACLVMPLVIFAARPKLSEEVFDGTSVKWMAILKAATLVLALPSIVLNAPAVHMPGRMYPPLRLPLSRLATCLAVVAVALVRGGVASTLNDIMLFLALAGTYFLPALTHITTHYIRRPLSIVVPTAPGRQQPGSPYMQPGSAPGGSGSPSSSSPSSPPALRGRDPHMRAPSHDVLLQRKEKLLQRRRLGKRLFWDFGVWVVLLPVCGGGLVWTVGRIAGRF